MENYNNFEEVFENEVSLPEETYVKFYGPTVGRYYWNGSTKFQRSKARDFFYKTKETDFEDRKRELEENGEICLVFPDTVVSYNGVRFDNFIVMHVKNRQYDDMYHTAASYVPANINHMNMYKDKKYDYVNTLKSKLKECEKENNVVRNLEDYSVKVSYGKNMDLSNCDEKEKQNIDFCINQVIKNVLEEPNTPDGTNTVWFQDHDGEIVLCDDLIKEGKAQKIVGDNQTFFVWNNTDKMKSAQSCILTDDCPMYFVGGSNIKGKYIVIGVRRLEHSAKNGKKILLHVMYGEVYN